MDIRECTDCGEYKYIEDDGKCQDCFDDSDDFEYPDRMVYGTKYQMLKDIADKNDLDIDDMDVTTVYKEGDET